MPEHHRIQLSGVPRSNGKLLRVRCFCMAQLDPAAGFAQRLRIAQHTGFDWLEDVITLEQAKAVFGEHVRTGATRVLLATL